MDVEKKKEIRVEFASSAKKDGTELSDSGGQRIRVLDPRAKDCLGFVTGAVH
jgi:hypothetical protein